MPVEQRVPCFAPLLCRFAFGGAHQPARGAGADKAVTRRHMQQTDDYHFSFSLAVLGEAAVGKSRMIRCTLPPPHDYEEDEDPAVDHGVRCRSHTYESRGARYQIFMWEVPGAARYLESATRYTTMAAGVLLVFDLTRRSTFERLPLWLEQALA